MEPLEPMDPPPPRSTTAEKQRQRRCTDARLTESRNARSKRLFVAPTESLTHQEWLPGELDQNSEGLAGF